MSNINSQENKSNIPEFDIIDLDENNLDHTQSTDEDINETDEPQSDTEGEEISAPPKSGIKKFLNIHLLLVAVLVISVFMIVFRLKNWGTFIDQADIERDESGQYLDVLDNIVPLTDENGRKIVQDVKNIAVFGNAPFADDRDSKDNLANMIAEATGANVYNCSIDGSFLAARNPYFDASISAMDAYTFYWLTVLGITKENAYAYEDAAKALGDNIPDVADEVVDTLLNLDYNNLDLIVVMYDATDYLYGHQMYNDSNSTDIEQFTGNLEAGIELIQKYYPEIRIIVMSPTYAYAKNENGDYISSDIYTYGQDVLSTYAIKEYASCSSRGVSFIDNIYGTITEANADDYLIDNIHINVEGRKLLLDRFLYVLNFFN